MKKWMMGVVALGFSVCGTWMVAQDAEACSCAFPQKQFKAFYPEKGNLPGNSKGITVSATHWPKDVQVMPKAILDKVTVERMNGKKATKLAFEIRYLGQVAKKTNPNIKTLPAGSIKFGKISKKPVKKTPSLAQTRQGYLNDLQRNMYMIVPKGGMVAGATYRVRVSSPAAYWQMTKAERAAKKREKVFERVVTLDQAVLKAPATLATPKMSRAMTKVSVPAGASCRRQMNVEGVTLNMGIPDKYKDSFVYGVFVDGQLWQPKLSLCNWPEPGRSQVAKMGQALIYETNSMCDASKKRKVEVVAVLPGTGMAWWFAPSSIALDCKKSSSIGRSFRN